MYRGCSHGCIYCDSRSTCYKITDFEDIEVKAGAARILEEELRRKRNPCMVLTGSMCDPYIPLEEDLKLTRRCLELIEKYGFGLSILTKSARILRDLDLLKAINDRAKCVVQTTLTSYDEALCAKIEPGVCGTRERVRALEIMRDNGIPTVVWLSPILPFINDTEENLLGLLDYCARARAGGIMCMGFGVTLREGNREYFYNRLDALFPGVKEKYIRRFGNSYVCNSPDNERLSGIFKNFCKQRKILWKPEEVFGYLQKYEKKDSQLSLF